MGIFSRSPVPCDKGALLIVDDEAQIRSLFDMVVKNAFPGIRIDQACNGLEAVRSFQEKHHGVIIMDLRMPVMDGLQAFLSIERMCHDENIQMPAVVFCTGFSPPETVNQIVASGQRHILLRKPPQSADLVQAITASLKA